MDRTVVTEEDVTRANRVLYDAVAERYEALDGRRGPGMTVWLRGVLADLRERAPGGRLLDVGTGAGLVTRCARGLFSVRVGLDLSPRLLAGNRGAFDLGVAGDLRHMPFLDRSFDAVTCFATLHHLFRFEGLVAEVRRILRPGGFFYADHDMDRAFRRRFALPLALYRRWHNAAGRFRAASPGTPEDLYGLTEWQAQGVDGDHLAALLSAAGFCVETGRHWFGLHPALDKLFGKRELPTGWAPLLRVWARKERP